MDSFFGKNGTIQGLMNFASNYQGASSAKDRLGSLAGLVAKLMTMFA